MNTLNQLRKISKYIPDINTQSRKYKVDEKILLSIAILENINRPWWVRLGEMLTYKFFPIKTFGLMQVSSQRYVDDFESIGIAAKYVSSLGLDKDNIVMVGKMYNGSFEYGRCLKIIYGEIKDIMLTNQNNLSLI